VVKGSTSPVRGVAMALSLATGLTVAPTAPAAIISEVFFAGGPAPDAVELQGLAAVDQPFVDLVVLDASPRLGPLVRQVVTLPTTHDTLLVSETGWPADLWFTDGAPAGLTTLAALGAEADWQFTTSRTLVVFDRRTNLVADLNPLALQQHKLAGVAVLDRLTFERTTPAQAWDGETVLAVAAGQAIVVPFDAQGFALPPIVAVPGVNGLLAGVDPPYTVSPGRVNPLRAADLPEPAAAAMLAAVALFYASHRPIMDGYAR